MGVGVEAVLSDRDLALVGNVGSHPGDELQIIHHLRLSLDRGGKARLRPANHGEKTSTGVDARSWKVETAGDERSRSIRTKTGGGLGYINAGGGNLLPNGPKRP